MVWIISFFLAGYFLSAVILAGIAAASTDMKEANQASMLIMIPNAAPMYALPLLTSNADGALAQTLSFIPFTAPLTMMMRFAFGDPATLDILVSLALVVLAGAGSLWLSARVFRAGLLMYGQRLSLRRVISSMRQAG